MREPAGRRARVWARALLAALAIAAACATPRMLQAEEFDPAKVPWDQIEAWAAGKSDQNPFKPGAAAQPQPPQPQPQPAKTQQPPDQPKKEPDPPPKSDWTPRPGARRPEPPSVQQFKQKAAVQLDDDVKDANRKKDLRQLYDLYFRHDQYDMAMQALVQIAQDPKRFPGEHSGPWLSERYWQTGILTRPRAPQPALDKMFQDWDQKIPHNDKDQGWVNWYNASKEYFNNSAKVLNQIQDLDQKGDVDPSALWQLCETYQQGRPASTFRYIIELYKLRDWYGDSFVQAQNGEVQWRLFDHLYSWLHMHELASEEAKYLIEHYPQHWSVKNGDAYWGRAEALLNMGYALPRGVKAYELWEEARKIYLFIQNRFPQLQYVKDIKKPPDPNANKSEIQLRIEDLNNRLRSQK